MFIQFSFIILYILYFAEILEYHVVPHTEYSAGLYNREFLRTLDRHHDTIRVHAYGKEFK